MWMQIAIDSADPPGSAFAPGAGHYLYRLPEERKEFIMDKPSIDDAGAIPVDHEECLGCGKTFPEEKSNISRRSGAIYVKGVKPKPSNG